MAGLPRVDERKALPPGKPRRVRAKVVIAVATRAQRRARESLRDRSASVLESRSWVRVPASRKETMRALSVRILEQEIDLARLHFAARMTALATEGELALLAALEAWALAIQKRASARR